MKQEFWLSSIIRTKDLFKVNQNSYTYTCIMYILNFFVTFKLIFLTNKWCPDHTQEPSSETYMADYTSYLFLSRREVQSIVSRGFTMIPMKKQFHIYSGEYIHYYIVYYKKKYKDISWVWFVIHIYIKKK